MKWFRKKPNKLNETTRLYALYGETANLEYLDNQDKETVKRVEVVENNLQQTNQNLNQTNQNLNQTNQNLNQTNNKVNGLENRIDNLPTIDTSKFATKNGANDFKGINTFEKNTMFLQDVVAKKVRTSDFEAAGLSTFGGYALLNQGGGIPIGNVTNDRDITNKSYVDGKIRWVAENAINSFALSEDRYMNTVTINKYTSSGVYIWQISRILCNMTWPPQNQIPFGRYLLTFTFLAEFSGWPKTEFKITKEVVHGDTEIELLENYQYVWITTFSGVGTEQNPQIKLKWIEGKRFI